MKNIIIAEYKNKQIVFNTDDRMLNSVRLEESKKLYVNEEYATNSHYKSRFIDCTIKAIAKVSNTRIGDIIIYMNNNGEIVFNNMIMYKISIIDTNLELLDEI